MALKNRTSEKLLNFDLPVSYRVNETRMRFKDALNIFSNQGKGETRFGRSLVNSEALPGSVLSMSFFKHADGSRFLIAKVGEEIYAVDSSGDKTLLKSGLSPNTKHRGITLARGASSRHIITVESDGLFQFDGGEFTQLGQDAPAPPSIEETPGAVADGTYRVAVTFYSSITGFESNASELSNMIGITAKGIKVTDIPQVADNGTIDKVRIYLKNTESVDDPVFTAEIDLGTAEYEIIATPLSTTPPPIGQGKPLAGGGKYLTEFNRRLVYAGNTNYKNDVFFSEEDTPDAFNDGSLPDRLVLFATLDGDITGLATGLYNNSVLDPFLVVFKMRSTHIYSEINGEGRFLPISSEIGCVSHDTIKVKNGEVYFLSDQGWRVIRNGSFVVDEEGNPITLGNGDIDDIFRSPGFSYEVNKSRLVDTFSVYYSALDQYITWVAEGARNDFSKAYVYEFSSSVPGFKPYEFASSATAACIGEDGEGVEMVFMADADGHIYRHSIKEERRDHDKNGASVSIKSFGQLIWLTGKDMDATYNFRKFLIRRLVGGGDLTLKVWVNYSMDDEQTFVIEGPVTGFILDSSKLDIDFFGSNDRSIITNMLDINSTCESIMFGFYQNVQNGNIGLVSAQVDFSKNKARTL